MIIRFSHGKDKSDTLTCIRDDGAITYAPSAVGVRHDLIHYAVETTLGCTEAFFGLVAAGRDVDDFGTKDGRKDTYPVEAIQVEFIVALLQWPTLTDAELTEQLAIDCTNRGLPTPEISAEQWAAIHDRIGDLAARWAAIPAQGKLELPWPGPAQLVVS